MFYYAPRPIMWVTPLSAYPTPVPTTASYYTVPQYYAPPAAPVEPVAYGMPMAYGAPYASYAPYAYDPYYYTQVADPCYCGQVAAPKPPRGEYRCGRCLVIC